MKRIKSILLSFGIIAALTSQVFAQADTQQERDLIKSLLGTTKKEYVQSLVDVPADKTNQFWQLYNDYETTRSDYGQEKFNLLQEYASNYGSFNGKLASHLINSLTRVDKDYEDLMKRYTTKIIKSVNPETALQFYQVESYIRTSVDAAVYGETPLAVKTQ